MGFIDLYGNYLGFMKDLYMGFIDDIPLVEFHGCLGS